MSNKLRDQSPKKTKSFNPHAGERSVKFTYRLSCVAFVAVFVNLAVQMFRGAEGMADYALFFAGVVTFSIMQFLWIKEKREKGIAG